MEGEVHDSLNHNRHIMGNTAGWNQPESSFNMKSSESYSSLWHHVMFTWSKLLDLRHSIWFKFKTVFIYITPNQSSHFKTSTFTQSVTQSCQSWLRIWAVNNQVMINVLNDHDDYSEQQNLKMNVNVILNVFLFVCLFYKVRTNSVQWINESAGFSITVHG